MHFFFMTKEMSEYVKGRIAEQNRKSREARESLERDFAQSFVQQEPTPKAKSADELLQRLAHKEKREELQGKKTLRELSYKEERAKERTALRVAKKAYRKIEQLTNKAGRAGEQFGRNLISGSGRKRKLLKKPKKEIVKEIKGSKIVKQYAGMYKGPLVQPGIPDYQPQATPPQDNRSLFFSDEWNRQKRKFRLF
jgi:hypothetical protein